MDAAQRIVRPSVAFMPPSGIHPTGRSSCDWAISDGRPAPRTGCRSVRRRCTARHRSGGNVRRSCLFSNRNTCSHQYWLMAKKTAARKGDLRPASTCRAAAGLSTQAACGVTADGWPWAAEGRLIFLYVYHRKRQLHYLPALGSHPPNPNPRLGRSAGPWYLASALTI